MKVVLEELRKLFRDPRDIHRVIMIAPLGAMLSHGIHLASLSNGLPPTGVEYMSIFLASVLYGMMDLWTVFSNEIHFRLTARFAFMAMFGAFTHRAILGIGVFTGITKFELVFFVLCASVVAFFVATGKSINEVKDRLNEITTNKPKDPGGSGSVTDLSSRRTTG